MGLSHVGAGGWANGPRTRPYSPPDYQIRRASSGTDEPERGLCVQGLGDRALPPNIIPEAGKFRGKPDYRYPERQIRVATLPSPRTGRRQEEPERNGRLVVQAITVPAWKTGAACGCMRHGRVRLSFH